MGELNALVQLVAWMPRDAAEDWLEVWSTGCWRFDPEVLTWLNGHHDLEPHDRHESWTYFGPFNTWLAGHPHMPPELVDLLHTTATEEMWAS